MDEDEEFNQRFNEQLKMFSDIDTIVTKAAQENGIIQNSNGNNLEKTNSSPSPNVIENNYNILNNNQPNIMMIQSKVNDFTIENKPDLTIVNKYTKKPLHLSLMSPDNWRDLNYGQNIKGSIMHSTSTLPNHKQMKKTFSYYDFSKQGQNLYANSSTTLNMGTTINNNYKYNNIGVNQNFIPKFDKRSLKIAEKFPSFEERLNQDKENRKMKKKLRLSTLSQGNINQCNNFTPNLGKSNSCSTLNKHALCEDLYLRGLEMIRNQREKRKLEKLKKDNSYLKYSFKPELNLNVPRSKSSINKTKKDNKDDIYQRSQKWIRNVSNKIDKKKQKENKNVLKNCTFKPVINSAYISDITNAKVKNDCTYKENKYSMMKVKNQAKTSKYNHNQPKTIKYSASYSNVNGTKSDVTNIRKEYGINSFFTNKNKKDLKIENNLNNKNLLDIDSKDLYIDYEEEAKFFLDDWNEDDMKTNFFLEENI